MEFLGYEVAKFTGELIGAPGACNECLRGQAGDLNRPWGQGHFLCESIPDILLKAEKGGDIECHLSENKWTWYLLPPK